MALTEYDKQRVLDQLDMIDNMAFERITSSQDSFERWLSYRLPDIYRKIKAVLRRTWEWIRSLFR
jgi:hypothetical protein